MNAGYALLPDAGRERINAFDWYAAFPEVFERGGFDCVIGNPPYVKLQNYKRVLPEVADYLRRATAPGLGQAGPRYRSAQTGNTDLFLPFIEKGIALLRPAGRLGYIAPSLWLLNEYGEGLRELVHRGQHLDRWMNFGSVQVFEEAITYTALQFFTAAPNAQVRFHDASSGSVVPEWTDPELAVPYADLPASEPWTLLPGAERDLMRALHARCDRLGSPQVTAGIFQGLITSADDVYHLRRLGAGHYITASGEEVALEDELMVPLVSGKDVSRWSTPNPAWHILFPYAPAAGGDMRLIAAPEMIASYPLAWAYLSRHETLLRARENGVFDDGEWHRFGRSQGLNKQKLPKLFVAQTVQQLEVAPDAEGAFAADNVRVNCILPAQPQDFWFLLAVLHGRVCDWIFRRIAKPKSGGYFEANKQFIAPLPIPRADPATKAALGKRALIARALHTRRDRAHDLLHRRLSTCTIRTEKEEWLLAGQVTPLADLKRAAPATLTGREKTAWAKARQADQAAQAMSRAAMLLGTDARLAVAFEQGELRITANGMPVFDRIFLSPEEGSFIALQWRLALRGAQFIGEAGAAALADGLRRVARTDNGELRRQAQSAGTRVLHYEQAIARNEAALEELLDTAYRLSPEEKRIITGARD
ncbi:MAG: Eco57I restriction-modification methylase domain-containing protein [Falsiroseomonas sp.]|nr:Eco57I restriction-modification methylase domain-containing protein [Falsiroseomonas sp.]MDO9501365.1 Eco57I restriction-modification methylase domain-containing protein [Falsiroseomonas sp.]